MLLAAAGYVAVFRGRDRDRVRRPGLDDAGPAGCGGGRGRTVGLLFAGAVTARNLLGDSGRVAGRDNVDRNYADRSSGVRSPVALMRWWPRPDGAAADWPLSARAVAWVRTAAGPRLRQRALTVVTASPR
jgi:hypothetical protein